MKLIPDRIAFWRKSSSQAQKEELKERVRNMARASNIGYYLTAAEAALKKRDYKEVRRNLSLIQTYTLGKEFKGPHTVLQNIYYSANAGTADIEDFEALYERGIGVMNEARLLRNLRKHIANIQKLINQL